MIRSTTTATALACAILAACSSTPPATEAKAPAMVSRIEASQPTAINPSLPVDISAIRPIYFGFDQYAVAPEYAPVIDTMARYLKADSRRKIVLAGHTDERGGREYNLALGVKRATAVQRQLILLGAAESQTEALSYGEEKHAVPEVDDASRALNRRVEFITP